MTSKQQLPFQRRVVDWMMETFSMEVCRNTTERNHRFLEEALELVQAMGCTAAEAHMLVDYTFGRPVGDPEQEVGGAMVTLAALCAAADISMTELGERELARCWQNIDRIRAKQAGKPRSSPLPGPSPDETSRDDAKCVRIVANIAHAALHILDDYAEENAQTGEVIVEIPKWAWAELNGSIDRLGDDPHEVLHQMLDVPAPAVEPTEVYTQEALDAAHARTRERLSKLKVDSPPVKASGPQPGDVLGMARMIHTGKLPPRKLDDEDSK